MTRVLIDTYTFLWFVSDVGKLSTSALSIFSSPGINILISPASIWEISIKFSAGRLAIRGGFASVEQDLKTNLIEMLPITFDHLSVNARLPFHHKDPFDRVIAARAISGKIDLVSTDKIFDAYFARTSSSRIW